MSDKPVYSTCPCSDPSSGPCDVCAGYCSDPGWKHNYAPATADDNTLAAINRAYSTGEARGRELGALAERARIVACLRQGAAWETRIIGSTIWHAAADAIENGAHERERNVDKHE